MKKFLSFMLAACLILNYLTFNISVNAATTIHPTAVSLDKTSAVLYVGDKVTLTATVTPSNATNKNVTWTSSAPLIAAVSSSGVVTGAASGKAKITVRTVDGGKTANCTVTVSVKNGTAKLIFEFDDGYKEDITAAAPVLKAKGFKGTAFVVKDAIMQLWGNTYMNLSDVNNLYNNYGWDIGNHTVTHPHGTGTDSTTITKLTNEYKTCQEWILLNGWIRGAYHADYPYGEYSTQLINSLKGIGVLTGRTAFPDAVQSIPVSDFYKLACQGVQNGNVTAVKSKIDTAVSTGSTLILVTHKIQTTSGTYAISKTDFQSIVDYASQYVQQSKLNVVTISEWYNSITAQPSATVTAVNSISDINVANGTTLSNAGLPASVKVTLSDGTTPTVNVTWDGGTPAYNGNAANTYAFSGALSLPSGVTNPGNLKAAVKVTVGQPTVKAVNPITAINVANGTEFSSIGLPVSVKVTLSDSTTQSVSVTWDGGTPAYDGNAANTYIFSGILALPSGVTNPDNLKAAVNVIVLKPEVTLSGVDAIPDINVANGTTLGNAGLPASVKVTLSDGTTTMMNVTWDGGTPSYNGNTANTYVFLGMLALPSGVTNPGNLKASVKVIVGQPTVKSIDSIANINAANGTVLSNAGLPVSVKITLSDGTTPVVNVTWDGGTPAYDGNTANTYVFAGTLALPSGVTNPDNLKAAVNVIVAKSVVTVTGVNLTADINVANGTTLSNAGLPASVQITLSDGTTPAVNVTWNGGTPVYNGNVANTYVFSGTLTLPSGVINPGNLKAAVKIIVGQPTVKGVNSIADINVANGTSLNSAGRPASVKITLSDGTTPIVNVTWDGGTPAYNGNAANTYVFSGTLSLSAGITNPANLKAAVRIIVAASKPAAKLLFTFDDGYDDDLLIAAPALQAKGFKGTAYVIQEGVLQLWDDTYMNLSEVNSLYNNYGWDISNHTLSHPNGTGTSSTALANLKNEYLANQQWLISNGWTRGAYHVAYPFGEYSSQLITILKGIGVLTARTAFPDVIQPLPVIDFYQLSTYALQDGNSSEVKSQIASVVNSGSTLILMIHEIKDSNEEYAISKSEFQSVVDYAAQYVQQGKLDVTTISEWYNSVK